MELCRYACACSVLVSPFIASIFQAGVVELIEEHGVDERFGQLDGLFGAGNYFAENASKVRWRPCLPFFC